MSPIINSTPDKNRLTVETRTRRIKIAAWVIFVPVVAFLIYLWGKSDLETYKRKFPNATTGDWVWDVVNGR